MENKLTEHDKKVIAVAYTHFVDADREKYKKYCKKIYEANLNGDKETEYLYTKKMALIITEYLPLKEKIQLMKNVMNNRPKISVLSRISKVKKTENQNHFSRKVLKGLSIEKRLEILKREYSKNPPKQLISKRLATFEINALSYLVNLKTIKNERDGYVDKATAGDEDEYRNNVEQINKNIEEGNEEKAEIDKEMKELAKQMEDLRKRREMIENRQKMQMASKITEDTKINVARENAKIDFNSQLAETKTTLFDRLKYFVGEKISKLNIWRKERKQNIINENQKRLEIAIDKKGTQFGEEFYQGVDEKKAIREARNGSKTKRILKQL